MGTKQGAFEENLLGAIHASGARTRDVINLTADLAIARARIADLEKALEPFDRACRYNVLDDEHDMDPIHKMGRASRAIEVGDLRRARAALSGEDKEETRG